MENIINPLESRNYLEQDMCALNDLGQRWSLAIYWVGSPTIAISAPRFDD
jgi:hypothetical protein